MALWTRVVILLVTLVLALSTVDAGRKNKYSPGVLLRDLLNNDNEDNEDSVLSPDDLLNSESDEVDDLSESSYRPGDRDPAIDDLLASLTEHGIQSEKPSAHFLLGLYERLQRGEDLPEATGQAHDDSVKQADTIRSFTAQGKIWFN